MTDFAKWNWQQRDWPEFGYDSRKLAALEAEFLRCSGLFTGSLRHVTRADREQLAVEIMSDEGLSTSEIEGEVLSRESLQSSIRRHFGLAADHRRVPPAEQGMAQMMVDLYRDFTKPLSHASLFHWHRMIMNGRRDLAEMGAYRTGMAPMQIVSGPIHAPRIHYEAPSAAVLREEMAGFIQWFNHTAPGGKTPLPALIRAGIAHWHFVSIHPFEDGNGRIARALAEKALAQSLGEATLIALSRAINSRRKAYYQVLERSSRSNEITDWLLYFSKTVLEAQASAQQMVEFLIAKTRFFDRLRGQLNERQEKVLARVFREGPGGFEGGLSAEKYIRLTGTSRATATRDLRELVEKKAVSKTGTLKGTRYHLLLARE